MPPSSAPIEASLELTSGGDSDPGCPTYLSPLERRRSRATISCFKIASFIAHDPDRGVLHRGPSALAATLVSSLGAAGVTRSNEIRRSKDLGLPQAVEAAQMAVALGYYALGLVEGPTGRCEQGIAHIKQAFALSPRDPISDRWHMYLGINEAWCGRLDAALAEIRQSIDTGFRAAWTYAILAGAEAAKGDDADANLALAEARRLNPELTMKGFPVPLPSIIVEGLRKVGLREE